MKRHAFLYVLIVLVSLFSIIAGACRIARPPEIPEDWILYNDKETGIAFYYPPEWGEVIDHADHLRAELPSIEEQEDISRRTLEYRKARIEALEIAADAGQYLAFSNLDTEWATHIRITSVKQIQEFLSEASNSQEELQGELQPLFGWGSQVVLGYYPNFPEQLTQLFEDIIDLPADTSVEDFDNTAFMVFFLFANGIRLPASDPDIIIPLRTAYGQVTTYDGKLNGAIQIGTEGFDVAARDFWDCILISPDKNRFVYLSFTLELPHYGAWDNPVEWAEGSNPPGMEELLEELQTQFVKFAKSIKLYH